MATGAPRGQVEAGAAVRFLAAGHAILTVENPRTGARFTYRVKRARADKGRGRPWFVGVLTGPDNTADYAYAGMLVDDGGAPGAFARTRASRIDENAPSFRAFAWMWDRLRAGRDVAPAVLWHEGRCGRCGRLLTVPESVESGYGPECATKVAA